MAITSRLAMEEKKRVSPRKPAPKALTVTDPWASWKWYQGRYVEMSARSALTPQMRSA